MIHFRKVVGKTLCGQRSAYKSESTFLAKEVTCSKCKNILLKNTMLMSEEEIVWMNDSQKQRHKEEVANAKELRDINEKLRNTIVKQIRKISKLEEKIKWLEREKSIKN